MKKCWEITGICLMYKGKLFFKSSLQLSTEVVGFLLSKYMSSKMSPMVAQVSTPTHQITRRDAWGSWSDHIHPDSKLLLPPNQHNHQLNDPMLTVLIVGWSKISNLELDGQNQTSYLMVNFFFPTHSMDQYIFVPNSNHRLVQPGSNPQR